jgi:hypothetical protein
LEGVQRIGSEVDLEEWGNETIIRNIDRLYLAETGQLLPHPIGAQ